MSNYAYIDMSRAKRLPAIRSGRAAEKVAWLGMPGAATFEKLEALRGLAAEACMSIAQYAVAWVLLRPGVPSVITRCRSFEQLEPLIAAAGTPIPPAHLARVDALFPPPKPAGEQVPRRRGGKWLLAHLEIEGG
jgi:aryl-alcohol dehydrogenase-like predicted oxidoreductase